MALGVKVQLLLQNLNLLAAQSHEICESLYMTDSRKKIPANPLFSFLIFKYYSCILICAPYHLSFHWA